MDTEDNAVLAAILDMETVRDRRGALVVRVEVRDDRGHLVELLDYRLPAVTTSNPSVCLPAL